MKKKIVLTLVPLAIAILFALPASGASLFEDGNIFSGTSSQTIDSFISASEAEKAAREAAYPIDSYEAEAFSTTEDLPKGANQSPNRAAQRAQLEKEKQELINKSKSEKATAAVSPEPTAEELEARKALQEKSERNRAEEQKAVEEVFRITSQYSGTEYRFSSNMNKDEVLSFYAAAVEVYAAGAPSETEMHALASFIDDYYFSFTFNGDFIGHEDLQKRVEEVLPTVTRYNP